MTAGSDPLAYRRLRRCASTGPCSLSPRLARFHNCSAQSGRPRSDGLSIPRPVAAQLVDGRAARTGRRGAATPRPIVPSAAMNPATACSWPATSPSCSIPAYGTRTSRSAGWREHQALAVNLVVDSDTIKHMSLRVPGGSLQSPLVESIAFDAAVDEIPYEERDIEDRALFSSFGDRACSWIRGIVPHPLVEQFWPLVNERARATRNLGECLSQARHALEAQWGLETLEMPQSLVCALPSFHWFTAHLLAQLPRFRAVYNQAVDAYRRVNRVRSANHPVPNLAADEEWIERRYWLWSSPPPRRRRVFVRRHAGGMTLTDRRRVEIELPLADDGDPQRAVEALAGLAAQGVKLRSRALVTTLFARLVLSDLFVHGIGGAKYDQLTDELIRSFYGCAPPATW